MKLLNKSNFIPVVCVVYTILSMTKVIIEAIFQNKFGNYQENLLMMLFLSFLATFVLSQHYRFHNLPLTLVIILQYLLLVAIVVFLTWLTGFYSRLSPYAYRDMFLSFTISYIIGAIIYYYQVYQEVKKANQILENLKKRRQ